MPSNDGNPLQARCGFVVSLDWHRCPDGFKILEIVPPPLDEHASLLERIREEGMYFEQKTKRREPLLLELTTLEDLLALRFANTRNEDDLLRFFGRFGTPIDYRRISVEDAAAKRDQMVTFVQRYVPGLSSESVRSGDVQRVNSFLAQFWLAPELKRRKGGKLLLALRPRSLWQYMFMECIVAGSLGANVHTCLQCGDFFLSGSFTGRRAQSKFCSDRCRVAHFRLHSRG